MTRLIWITLMVLGSSLAYGMAPSGPPVSVSTVYLANIKAIDQKQYQSSGSRYDISYTVIYVNVTRSESDRLDKIFSSDTVRYSVLMYIPESGIYTIRIIYRGIYAYSDKQANDIALKQLSQVRQDANAVIERKSAK